MEEPADACPATMCCRAVEASKVGQKSVVPRVSRAGREPAEDVKKRVVAACQEAGLNVWSARMRVRHQQHDRLIQIDAATSEGRFRRSVIGIVTAVDSDGSWSGRVKISCAAAEDGASASDWKVPVMRGRDAVPLRELVEQLVRTVEERKRGAAAHKAGIAGPYTFEQTHWQIPSDETK